MKTLLMILLLMVTAEASDKIALLIGNSKYQNLERLSSPKQDIPELAQKLRGMGFDVTSLYDLDEKSMKKAINDFKRKLHANPNSIALFYYSGHGSQAYGDSYLIPIDGDTHDQGDVEADGVKVENIAQKMANARTKVNILFLDACRDVPTGTMGGTKGLGQVKRQPSSTLILYSTSKNKTAQDDRLFNKTVLSKIGLNKDFSSLANSISYSVGRATNGKQVPELLSTGLPEIVLGESKRCSKVVKVPAKYKTKTKKVLVKDGTTKKIVAPGIFRTKPEHMLYKPSYYKYIYETELGKSFDGSEFESFGSDGSTSIVSVRPKLVLKTKKVQIAKPFKRLVADGNDIKEVSVPARYRTFKYYEIDKESEREILAYLEGKEYKKVFIPATYKTITKRVIVKPYSIKTVSTPATYKTVTEKVLVSPETEKTISVPCSEID